MSASDRFTIGEATTRSQLLVATPTGTQFRFDDDIDGATDQKDSCRGDTMIDSRRASTNSALL